MSCQLTGTRYYDYDAPIDESETIHIGMYEQIFEAEYALISTAISKNSGFDFTNISAFAVKEVGFRSYLTISKNFHSITQDEFNEFFTSGGADSKVGDCTLFINYDDNNKIRGLSFVKRSDGLDPTITLGSFDAMTDLGHTECFNLSHSENFETNNGGMVTKYTGLVISIEDPNGTFHQINLLYAWNSSTSKSLWYVTFDATITTNMNGSPCATGITNLKAITYAAFPQAESGGGGDTPTPSENENLYSRFCTR